MGMFSRKGVDEWMRGSGRAKRSWGCGRREPWWEWSGVDWGGMGVWVCFNNYCTCTYIHTVQYTVIPVQFSNRK